MTIFFAKLLKPNKRNNLTGPGGGIGRHAGLKILYPLKMCGFKSRPGYQLEYVWKKAYFRSTND